jgi:hypothetical protein
VVYSATLYDLLKAYGTHTGRRHEGALHILPTDLYSMDDALKRLSGMIGKAVEWSTLVSFLPPGLAGGLVRAQLAATFAASLEMASGASSSGPHLRSIYLRRSEDPQPSSEVLPAAAPPGGDAVRHDEPMAEKSLAGACPGADIRPARWPGLCNRGVHLLQIGGAGPPHRPRGSAADQTTVAHKPTCRHRDPGHYRLSRAGDTGRGGGSGAWRSPGARWTRCWRPAGSGRAGARPGAARHRDRACLDHFGLEGRGPCGIEGLRPGPARCPAPPSRPSAPRPWRKSTRCRGNGRGRRGGRGGARRGHGPRGRGRVRIHGRRGRGHCRGGR